MKVCVVKAQLASRTARSTEQTTIEKQVWLAQSVSGKRVTGNQKRGESSEWQPWKDSGSLSFLSLGPDMVLLTSHAKIALRYHTLNLHKGKCIIYEALPDMLSDGDAVSEVSLML